MDSDVYNPLKGHNIPCQGGIGMTCKITKYDAHKEDLFTHEAHSFRTIRVRWTLVHML